MHLRLSLVCLFLALGCSSVAPSGGLSKDEVRAAKADGVPGPRVCEALGEPAGCDVCEVASWYGDGECDDFCDRRDSDCGSEFEDVSCETIGDNVSECVAEGTSPAECVPAPEDGLAYEAALSCCASSYGFCDDLPEPSASYERALNILYAWFGYWSLPAGPTGKHVLGGYSPSAFSAATFAGSMRDFDREVRGCERRIYSRSKEDGIDKFFEFVERREAFAGIPDYRAEKTEEGVRNADNLAVFASVPDINAATETCNYADFYVFMDNGTVAHMNFDYRAEDADLRDGPGPAGILYVDEADSEVWTRMNQYGHNGGSSIGVWTSRARAYDAIASYARVEDAVDWRCVNRTYSDSTEEARERFDAFAETYFEQTPWISEEEVLENTPGIVEDIATFQRIVDDPANIAVLSSEHTEGGRDYSESCLYYDFYILRPSGTAIRFQVNYTD